ncbi:S8 family serine peptidase [Deinococcus multiflagellatus]|uniref:Fervidolysin-like N-terminal prodomain domain-containing protein n=1 Tax=Deinococcus multiflagellatus TaxID=1656887 RepID=A0ABW1ZS97_9DEIO
MRKNLPLTLGVLGLTAMLAACSNQSAPVATAPAAAEQQLARIGNLQYVQNEVVVGYDTEAGLSAAVKAMGGELVRTIPEIKTALVRVSGDAMKLTSRAKVDGVRYASVNPVVIPDRGAPTITNSSLAPRPPTRTRCSTCCPSTRWTPGT